MKIKVKVNESMLKYKQKQIEELCVYGLTHFCDGKVNESEADPGTQRLPPCPHRKDCKIKMFSYIERK